MRNRLAKTMMAVLFIQALLFSLSLFGGNTVERVTSEYLQAHNNRVMIRRNALQEEMLSRRSHMSDFQEYIQKTYEKMGVAEDPSLIPELIEDLMEHSIFYLRQTDVTDLFVILDGEEEHEGIYFRDLDPTFNNIDNSDVRMEHGSMEIAKKMGVPLDPKWTYSFNLTPDDESSNYFYKPYETAKQYRYTRTQDLGYWSKPFKLNPNDDVEIITYSLPLTGEYGAPYGVVGIGLTTDYLAEKLKYDELSDNKRGFYVLSSHNQATQDKKLLTKNGPMAKLFLENEAAVYTPLESGHLYKVTEHQKINGVIYGSTHALNLYNQNTPFEKDRWDLTGFVESKYLFSPLDDIFIPLLTSLIFSLMIGIAAIYIASYLFMKPINKLMTGLKQSSMEKPFTLDKTNVLEVDALATAIERLNAEVLDSASKLSQILGMVNIPIGAFEYALDDDRAFCTATFFEILGLPNGEADNYVSKDFLITVLEEITQEPEQDMENVYHYRTPDGANSWFELTIHQHDEKVLGIIEDVTEDVAYKRQIEYERDHDILTHLLNRRAFATIVREKMEAGISGKSAFLMWDLDNLKYVNDTYGHEYGDLYIQKTAEVLKSFYFHNTVIARMSGDEFFVFIYDYQDKAAVRTIINEMKESLYNAFLNLPNGEKLRIRASGGVAWYPDDSTIYDELIKYTDFAMYQIKNSEKGNVGEFDKKMYEKDSILLDGKEELNFFIDQALVKYAFQPIVDARTGTIFAYEALMRPQTEKMQSPYDVIRLAQSQSKLYEIEKLTFFEVMKTYVQLLDEFAGAKLFLNSIANTTLSEEDFVEFERKYADHLDQLVIEITENEQADDLCTETKQRKVEEWGTHLALDDFGSGYNSDLSLLVLAPKYVKIDMNIVRDIDKDPNRQKLLQNILSYCENRQIKTIAEGVETREEMQTLIHMGVDYMQGYYLAKPDLVPPSIHVEIQQMIRLFQKN